MKKTSSAQLQMNTPHLTLKGATVLIQIFKLSLRIFVIMDFHKWLLHQFLVLNVIFIYSHKWHYCLYDHFISHRSFQPKEPDIIFGYTLFDLKPNMCGHSIPRIFTLSGVYDEHPT